MILTPFLRRSVTLACLFLLQACSNCGETPPGADDAGSPPEPVCVAGTEGCPCADEVCQTDLICRSDVCETCTWGTRDCPCAEGACGNGDVCDQTSQLCRAATECDAVCAQYQECQTAEGQDPVCLESCIDGYRWDGSQNRCVEIPSCIAGDPGFVDCGDRTCTANDDEVVCGDCLPGFFELDGECVVPDCDVFCPGRTCDESPADGGPPSCGDCLEGYLENTATGACVDLVTCQELTCDANEVCIPASLPSTDARCEGDASCPVGQVDTGAGECVDCVNCYQGETPLPGVVGIGNGGYAWESKCVCKLEEGYFQEPLAGEVKACDADGDGWTNADVVLTRTQNGGQTPLAAEQKCSPRKVSAFELRSDDYFPALGATVRQGKVVTIDDLVTRYALTGVPVDSLGIHYIELLEPNKLDDDFAFSDRYTAASAEAGLLHNYGGFTDLLAPPSPPDADGGPDDAGNADAGAPPTNAYPSHRLVAAESNPLTKFCNHDDDDLNLDGVPDVSQSHDFVNAADLSDDSGVAWSIFYRMAYFLELNRGFYVPGSEYGTYVIAEKSRLLGPTQPGGLDLTYPASEYEDYWQICARSRSPDYNTSPDNWNINNDFGAWYEGCDADSGSCLVGCAESGSCPVDRHVPYDGRQLITEAANLNAAADLLQDGSQRWPGMNHSSQFKCVSYANMIEPQASVAHRTPPADHLLESCRLDPRASDAPLSMADARNPMSPAFDCTPLDPTADAATVLKNRSGQNYFTALKPKQRPATYEGGCADEGIEWQHLCIVGSEPTDTKYSGELFCSCGPDRAGDQCELGCPDRYRFSNRQGNSATFALEGYWVCMTPSASDGTVLEDAASGYSLRGGVPAEATPSQVLCQTDADGNCDPAGYRVGAWSY